MITLPLYLLCLALELVHVLARFLVGYGIARAFGVAEDPAAWIAGAVAFLPLLLSLATYFFRLPGGWGLFWELGARRPSPREKETVEPVLDELRRRGAKTPITWFVIDDPVPNAQTLGRTIYINSGMIGHPSLDATLAHECGHIATRIGDRLLALVRLEFPGLRLLRVYLETEGWTITAKIVRVLSGGASWELPVIRSLWAAYLRRGRARRRPIRQEARLLLRAGRVPRRVRTSARRCHAVPTWPLASLRRAADRAAASIGVRS